MSDSNLGTATIVYEDPSDGTVERSVPNEQIAYFQDHWILKYGEDEAGNDVVRRIPVERVHYVERTVGEFSDEVGTLRNQVESFADDLRSRLLGGRDGGDEGGTEPEPEPEDTGPIEIEVESDEDTEE
jgi:hypothetical protein